MSVNAGGPEATFQHQPSGLNNVSTMSSLGAPHSSEQQGMSAPGDPQQTSTGLTGNAATGQAQDQPIDISSNEDEEEESSSEENNIDNGTDHQQQQQQHQQPARHPSNTSQHDKEWTGLEGHDNYDPAMQAAIEQYRADWESNIPLQVQQNDTFDEWFDRPSTNIQLVPLANEEELREEPLADAQQRMPPLFTVNRTLNEVRANAVLSEFDMNAPSSDVLDWQFSNEWVAGDINWDSDTPFGDYRPVPHPPTRRSDGGAKNYQNLSGPPNPVLNTSHNPDTGMLQNAITGLPLDDCNDGRLGTYTQDLNHSAPAVRPADIGPPTGLDPEVAPSNRGPRQPQQNLQLPTPPSSARTAKRPYVADQPESDAAPSSPLAKRIRSNVPAQAGPGPNRSSNVRKDKALDYDTTRKLAQSSKSDQSHGPSATPGMDVPSSSQPGQVIPVAAPANAQMPLQEASSSTNAPHQPPKTGEKRPADSMTVEGPARRFKNVESVPRVGSGPARMVLDTPMSPDTARRLAQMTKPPQQSSSHGPAGAAPPASQHARAEDRRSMPPPRTPLPTTAAASMPQARSNQQESVSPAAGQNGIADSPTAMNGAPKARAPLSQVSTMPDAGAPSSRQSTRQDQAGPDFARYPVWWQGVHPGIQVVAAILEGQRIPEQSRRIFVDLMARVYHEQAGGLAGTLADQVWTATFAHYWRLASAVYMYSHIHLQWGLMPSNEDIAAQGKYASIFAFLCTKVWMSSVLAHNDAGLVTETIQRSYLRGTSLANFQIKEERVKQDFEELMTVYEKQPDGAADAPQPAPLNRNVVPGAAAPQPQQDAGVGPAIPAPVANSPFQSREGDEEEL